MIFQKSALMRQKSTPRDVEIKLLQVWLVNVDLIEQAYKAASQACKHDVKGGKCGAYY